MPFITQEERKTLSQGEQVTTPGQRCYRQYEWMVSAWRRTPRWKTADEIYRVVIEEPCLDKRDKRAQELAWQVFFNLHVMKYEEEKRKLNGDI